MSVRAVGFTPGSVPGTLTNNNAPAGAIGELITSTVAPGTISLTTITSANVTSISLTAGDWDVTGAVNFIPTITTSITVLDGGANSTTATLPTQDNFFEDSFAANVPGTTVIITKVIPTQRFSLASTTTVFLVVQGTFTISALTAGGTIRARRMR